MIMTEYFSGLIWNDEDFRKQNLTTNLLVRDHLYENISKGTAWEIYRLYVKKKGQMAVSAEGIGVMKGSSFFQIAVMIMGSWLDLALADSQQVIKEEVTVMNLKPQYVIFLSTEIGKLLLPPGVGIVLTGGCCTQSCWATEHLDIAICGPQQVRGKTSGPQVKQPELGLSHTQTAQDQQEER